MAKLGSLRPEDGKVKSWSYFCPCQEGKAVPLQAWNGPEGSRMLRFPDFLITAQDGGRVVSLSTGRLYPQ
jgi:hypothetical protein